MCPICGGLHCYRQITPYLRYAIELFPDFRKERVPIGRFLCRRRRKTFSLLPIQLIPYFQYTVSAVIGTLLLAFRYWQMGRQGFYGASVAVHPDSFVTPYLVACWLAVIARGLRRAHRVLVRLYDLSEVKTSQGRNLWQEMSGYFTALGLKPNIPWAPLVFTLIHRYSQSTGRFLFGAPSQQRRDNLRPKKGSSAAHQTRFSTQNDV